MTAGSNGRDAYRHFQAIPTRWKDNDVYGHVNNVEYYSYFDTVINTYLIRAGGLDMVVLNASTLGPLPMRPLSVLTAAEIRRSWSRDRDADPVRDTDALLERIGIASVANRRVDALPTGLARLVELGRALATRPKVLLLDEPASGLDEAESDAFAALLLELATEGMAILLVEHDVQLVMRVCERIHVLDFGAILASGTAAEIQADQAVLDAYLGAPEPVPT